MHDMIRSVILLLAASVLCICAGADDTLATLRAGGLVPVKTTQISMQKEDLRISPREIEVRYTFRNDSEKNVESIVEFPLPVINGGDLYHVPIHFPSKDPVNFVEFRVWVNGAEVVPQVEIIARDASGHDVTAAVRAAGLPLTVDTRSFDAAVKNLAPDQLKRLTDSELLVDEGSSPRDFYWPTWELDVRFHWNQMFPANSTVEVRHVYKPIIGGSYLYLNAGEDAQDVKKNARTTLTPYCGTEKDAARAYAIAQKRQGQNGAGTNPGIYLYEKRIGFVLETANNWKGPIGDFHLTVTTGGPDDIFATCGTGVTQTSPATYEVHRTNFSPDRDLDILILQTQGWDTN